MKKRNNYVRVDYEKIRAGDVELPVYHTFIEIRLDGKVSKFGFKTKRSLKKYWPLSFFIPMSGRIKRETFKPDKTGEVLTRDDKKIRKLLKAIEKTHWSFYHMLLHNCFGWRNTVLKKALRHPRFFGCLRDRMNRSRAEAPSRPRLTCLSAI